MSVTLYGSGQTILQVVQTSVSTNFSTSSTTFVNSNLTASITPLSTSSKILVCAGFSFYYNTSGGATWQITRNGSAIFTQNVYTLYNGSNNSVGYHSPMYLDSPATTSAVTYTMQIAATSGTGSAYLPYPSNGPNVFILLEISGA
jgi:hypothetical protein